MPVEVGHTNPVKVWMRTGTRVNQPAIIHNNPALGVIECTANGFSLQNTRIILNKDFKSFVKEI